MGNMCSRCWVIDPEFVEKMSDEEIEFNIGVIRANRGRIVGIGEVGLDYKMARGVGDPERQKLVFGRMLDLAMELGLPVSVHARNSLDDVLRILEEKGVRKAHLHFFEGDETHAKTVEGWAT